MCPLETGSCLQESVFFVENVCVCRETSFSAGRSGGLRITNGSLLVGDRGGQDIFYSLIDNTIAEPHLGQLSSLASNKTQLRSGVRLPVCGSI